MRLLVFTVLATATVVTAAAARAKREAYALPDGSGLLLGSISTSFQCQGNGYYADVDNGCKIFHVCNFITHSDGSSEIQQYSFMCGNQTVFNQLTFTCAFEEESLPCHNAPDYFYLNGNLGDENAPFLSDNDIERAEPLIPVHRAAASAAAAASSHSVHHVEAPDAPST